MDLDKFIIDYGHYLNQGWEPPHILVPLPTYFSLPLPLPHTSTDTLSVTIGSIAFSRSEVKALSHVQLFVTPWTVAHQAPPFMGFSRQDSWSGLPFPSPGDLPDPGIEPRSPALQADALTSEPPGKHLEVFSRVWHKWKCTVYPSVPGFFGLP